MANVNLRIDRLRLRLRLRGIDAITAVPAGEGLAAAIVAELGPGALQSLREGHLPSLRLDPVTLPPDASALEVQSAAARAVGRALTGAIPKAAQA
jgi:hypothetical protein